MDPLRTFPRNLRAHRVRLGLSQLELAHRTDIGPSHVSMYETGRKLPCLATFVALCFALRCSPNELLSTGVDP